jgi:hypothetical protein
LDIPPLRDSEVDTFGFYHTVGASFADSNFSGAAVQQSLDNATYSLIATIAEDAKIGTARNALGTTSTPFVWDDVNTLTVHMTNGTTLSSSTDALVLAGSANWISLQSGATDHEIIGFVNATAGVDADTFVLSRLLRGRQGSEQLVGGHAIGDEMVVLDTTWLRTLTQNDSDLNRDYWYRAQALSAPNGFSTEEQFANTGVRFKPWAPAQETSSRAASPQDITFTWERRNRRAPAVLLADPLMDEGTVLTFKVDVDDNSSPGTTLISYTLTPTLDDTQPYSWIYTEAQRLTDGFTTADDSVKITVYQIGNLSIQGYGTVIQDVVVLDYIPAAANLTLSGFAPTIVVTVDVVIPSAGQLVLNSEAPTRIVNTNRSSPAADLTLSGQAPTVEQDTPIDPPAGDLALTGFAPTVVVT